MIEEVPPVAITELLEAACAVLAWVKMGMISRISVSLGVANPTRDVLQIDLLSTHLADQHGLEASVEMAGENMTATFRHPSARAGGAEPASGKHAPGQNPK